MTSQSPVLSEPEAARSPEQPADDWAFIWRMALMMSIVALGMDTILPASLQVSRTFAVPPDAFQWVVLCFIAGLSLGQLLVGVLADVFGRRRPALLSLLLFALLSLLTFWAESFAQLLVLRFLQGMVAAMPRVICIAMVRDRLQGRAMARAQSFIATVFMLVPMLAPALGELVLHIYGWRAIFFLLTGVALVCFFWLLWQQSETLPPAQRMPLSLSAIWQAVRQLRGQRQYWIYTLCAGFGFSPLVIFLGNAQNIFIYELNFARFFTLSFALLALGLAAATVLNGRWVMRLGMRWLLRLGWSLLALAGVLLMLRSMLFAQVLWLGLLALALLFFAMGFVLGNVQAMAMQHVGAVAGVAASLLASISNLVGLGIGVLFGWLIDGRMMQLGALGVCVAGGALGLMAWAERAEQALAESM